MTLESIKKAELAEALHLIGTKGGTSEWAVANLLRVPLSRWGLSPRMAVLRYAREQLRAAGLEDIASVPRILDRLVSLGECDEVTVGRDRYLAPAEPRWISVGAGVGVYLGVSALHKEVSRSPECNHRDIAQRILVESDDDAAKLHLAGVREISLEEWLSPIGYLRHATRRLRRPARSDVVTLGGFWEILESRVAEDGLPLSIDAEVRSVIGEPGQFFGRQDAVEPEGRWTSSAPDGLWCAFRRGYGEAHWHPLILAVNGEERRGLDLFDLDEWRWALLARGRRIGPEEVVLSSNLNVRLTFPAPLQLRAGMDLLGVPDSPWGWELRPGAPDIWALIS